MECPTALVNEKLFSGFLSSNDTQLELKMSGYSFRGVRTYFISSVASEGIDAFGWKARTKGHAGVALAGRAC
jgi:hypothetical protein